MPKLKHKLPNTIQQIALEEWAESNISTEGIGDIFASIKKSIKDWSENRVRRRKKPDPQRHKQIQMNWYWIAREIRKTYLNPVWLDARVSTETPIEASSFIKGLTFDNYVVNDASLVETAANQILERLRVFLPARRAYIKAFETEVMDRLVHGDWSNVWGSIDTTKLNMAVEIFFKTHGTVPEFIARTLAKIDISLPESVKLKTAMRGLQIVPVKMNLKTTTLTPLTKPQIVSAAHALVAAVEKVPEVYLNSDALILNIIDDYVIEHADEETGEVKQEIVMTSLEIKKAFALLRNDDLRLLLDEMSWNDNFYIPVTTAFDQLIKGLISAERYMAESIN